MEAKQNRNTKKTMKKQTIETWKRNEQNRLKHGRNANKTEARQTNEKTND